MSQVPRNKILIVFSSETSDTTKKDILSKIFVQIEKERLNDNIIKHIQWETKYYRAELDLYVDQYDTLSEWIKELLSEESTPLLEVLAGVIVIDDADITEHKGKFDQISTKIHDDSFLLRCINSEKIQDSQDEVLNDVLETVHLGSLGTVNEFGEKLGIERIKEILDTHAWDQDVVELLQDDQMKRHRTHVEDIDAIVKKLEEAKLQYQDLSATEMKEADLYALEIAEEIARSI
ncbi:hypothetical protein KAFR_0J00240 [Kazachstania africana CBS 2517]|uniref:Increased recombination centers protein 6 n=1 Tax=Kazachstania africana (strain ATCC 22294 / BCRC 22015 / CBS 2517 / CECT 1963 / NBRC 1671 / NRRL Y-8276) TaxID=1071382 RepID=H2B0E2_KAZAF|nr:hypothetical protein KAFR_0J00240 [Kazachstania africana CBS 2517]CCF60092.1 hypothetical protein KAFR_0J00240 [Kazachstania africana CBS 2517]